MTNTSHCLNLDFRAIGEAIKNARKERKWSRVQASVKVGISAGYLSAIENRGKKPGFDVFVSLLSLFSLSADELLFPESLTPTKSSARRQIDAVMDTMSDKELLVIKTMLVAYQTCAALGLDGDV